MLNANVVTAAKRRMFMGMTSTIKRRTPNGGGQYTECPKWRGAIQWDLGHCPQVIAPRSFQDKLFSRVSMIEYADHVSGRSNSAQATVWSEAFWACRGARSTSAAVQSLARGAVARI